jgi:hypothetical protein
MSLPYLAASSQFWRSVSCSDRCSQKCRGGPPSKTCRTLVKMMSLSYQETAHFRVTTVLSHLIKPGLENLWLGNAYKWHH